MSDSTRDHWWWRPGWRAGRSFYTWHVTFGENSSVRALVDRFAPLLERIPTMQPVAGEGLHITVQGIGFTDEVARADVEQIVTATAEYLGRREPFDAIFGPPAADRETIGLPVAGSELVRVRTDLQQAIGDVWGAQCVPERDARFGPHLSLAYSTGEGSISELQQLIDEAHLEQLKVTELISAVSLIELNRDHHRYEWVEVASVQLGSGR
ncbi:2'-5' RNA ligase family protein [Nocardia sp. CA2R105]|uniref:2'-5' RNA ligase family protein n=1 Tax=Nocardia coffeae TaxID=2873381 RepID=UPI001CA6ABB5|nr:2'-5' RNA ligase family protein [Nocardia coffeae]MBY8856574.1 2'-5' RNA ligase family protein [Nocardia coffeae]